MSQTPRAARPSRPLDLDDAPTPRSAVAPALWGLAKWAVLGVGLVLAVVALFGANAIQAGGLAGLACFLAIVARICQAEEHRPR